MTTIEKRQKAAGKSDEEVKQHVKFVCMVAEWLGEKGQHGFYMLHLIIQAIGKERTFDLLKQTLEVENNGGMRVLNGSRRRTVGGVFLTLAKQQYGDILPPAVQIRSRPGQAK